MRRDLTPRCGMTDCEGKPRWREPGGKVTLGGRLTCHETGTGRAGLDQPQLKLEARFLLSRAVPQRDYDLSKRFPAPGV